MAVAPARMNGEFFMITAKMFLPEIVAVSLSKGSELLSTGIQRKMG